MPAEGARRALGVLSVLFSVGVGVVGTPDSAWAGPDPAKLKAASESFALGASAYDAGKFAEAAPHFEAADASAPSPKRSASPSALESKRANSRARRPSPRWRSIGTPTTPSSAR
jgi:hypothetical protein